MHKAILTVFFLLSSIHTLLAQPLDLYRRVTDPRGIARLSGDDRDYLRHANGFRFPYFHDTVDNYFIVARDTGAGVITHIWMNTDGPDSNYFIKLWIDDKLILKTTFYSFFNGKHGFLRAPLDTNGSGGWNCDVQIPYSKNFRITYSSPSDWFFYNIAWRPLPTVAEIGPFQLTPNKLLRDQQIAAERRLYLAGSPWIDSVSSRTFFQTSLAPQNPKVVADITGPAMIQTLHFYPDSLLSDPRFDARVLDSVWIDIYWDGSPKPSVHVPFGDFFCAASGIFDLRALQLKANRQDGFTSYFPMPFYRRARIVLTNESSDSIGIKGFVQYSREPIDRTEFGYFHSEFHESNPTKYGVHHPIAYALGKGRFVGVSWGLLDYHSPDALEGNPIFTIDSSSHSFEYTGGEDYFDGGFYFRDGPFTLPFGGCLNIWSQFYRFHYLDAVDFNTSFDLKIQHGFLNDIRAHYRTAAYYYKEWTPFWCDRDSIRAGEIWTIGGSGYSPNQILDIRLGNAPILKVAANSEGAFSLGLVVQSRWKAGKQKLTINGVEKPEWIYLLDKPMVHLTDHKLGLPLAKDKGMHFPDSITIAGTGFAAGEQVTLFLDSIPFSTSPVIVSKDYRWQTTLQVPYLADHAYHVIARGDQSGETWCNNLLNLTRTIKYEFENLWPLDSSSPGVLYQCSMNYIYPQLWSEQMIVLAKPDPKIDSPLYRYRFEIPVSDTMQVSLVATVGGAWGDYDIELDGINRSRVNGYADVPGWAEQSDTLKLGEHFLRSGIHTITFRSAGKDPRSNDEHLLGPDFLLLTPTTLLPFAPGTIIPPVKYVESTISIGAFRVYPNPVIGDRIRIAGLAGGSGDFVLRDVLGRESLRTMMNTGTEDIFLQRVPNGIYVATFESTNSSVPIQRSLIRILR
jgi:hypothetical protein